MIDYYNLFAKKEEKSQESDSILNFATTKYRWFMIPKDY